MDYRLAEILYALFQDSLSFRNTLYNLDGRYDHTFEDYRSAKEKLKADLTPIQWETFLHAESAQDDRRELETETSFSAGLAAGIRLMQFALS